MYNSSTVILLHGEKPRLQRKYHTIGFQEIHLHKKLDKSRCNKMLKIFKDPDSKIDFIFFGYVGP